MDHPSPWLGMGLFVSFQGWDPVSRAGTLCIPACLWLCPGLGPCVQGWDPVLSSLVGLCPGLGPCVQGCDPVYSSLMGGCVRGWVPVYSALVRAGSGAAGEPRVFSWHVLAARLGVGTHLLSIAC